MQLDSEQIWNSACLPPVFPPAFFSSDPQPLSFPASCHSRAPHLPPSPLLGAGVGGRLEGCVGLRELPVGTRSRERRWGAAPRSRRYRNCVRPFCDSGAEAGALGWSQTTSHLSRETAPFLLLLMFSCLRSLKSGARTEGHSEVRESPVDATGSWSDPSRSPPSQKCGVIRK